MALIRFPEGQQRSGSVGGATFSHNRYGAYVRSRSVPVNPNTDRQVEVRNYTRSLAIGWQNTLSDIQRYAWDWYAGATPWTNKFGEACYLTGLNHYVRSNVPRLMAALTRLDNPPIIAGLATAELELGCSASQATQNATITYDNTADWCSETGGFEIFYAGFPRPGGINFFGGPWRVFGVQFGQDAPNGDPSGSSVVPWPWPIGEGQRLWIRSRVGRADGRLSEFARISFLCIA